MSGCIRLYRFFSITTPPNFIQCLPLIFSIIIRDNTLVKSEDMELLTEVNVKPGEVATKIHKHTLVYRNMSLLMPPLVQLLNPFPPLLSSIYLWCVLNSTELTHTRYSYNTHPPILERASAHRTDSLVILPATCYK